MASTVSIPKGNTDQNYRYKRPLIIITTYGQGGNLKTKIENIHDLAKSLYVPPEYPLKFIGYELGSQTDIKSSDYIISGKHSFDKLEELLEKFIAKYVICKAKTCKLPEIRIFIKKNSIFGKCKACSAVSPLDEKHKLGNYIKKFPPSEGANMTGVDVSAVSNNTNNSTQQSSTKIDKDKIKAFIKKLTEATNKNNNDLEIKSIINEIAADPGVNRADCKYFIYFHGIYDNNIYETFETKCKWLIYSINNEKYCEKEEAFFHVYIALVNLFIEKYIKKKEIYQELQTKIPSVLYLCYAEQLFSEDFIIERMINKKHVYKNIFYNENSDKAFTEKADEFLKWLQTAEYEE